MYAAVVREQADTRRLAGIGAAFVLVAAAVSACATSASPMSSPSGVAAHVAEVRLSPTCNCCTDYVAYLRRQGWTVEVIEEPDIAAFQDERGVPEAARGCHTTLVDGYAVEGHVPLPALERLLAERPAIDGIGLPGMPLGSPGMTGTATGPFTVVAFDAGEVTPFGEY